MLAYDFHIHTEYCGHAPGMKIADIIAVANKLKLDSICITDHIFSENELATIEVIRKEIEQIESNCKVIVGGEVDVDGSFGDGRLVTDKLDGNDYVIGSIHYIPGAGNFPLSPADCPYAPAEMMARWRDTLLGLVSNGRIDTLAHPGRMIAAAVNMDVFFDDVLAVFTEAAVLSVANNIAWELNELIGGRLSEYYRNRWHEIYEIAIAAGVKIIYGSDAHDLATIGTSQFSEMVLKKLPPNSLATPDQLSIENRK
jgi:histidinol phosphatase-like PHP family hydrolase